MLHDEATLEEFITKQQEIKINKLAQNTENVAKIAQRAADAQGPEEVRLLALLELHKSYTNEIELIDAVAIATEMFNKLEERRTEPEL
jgi:hypothetical protein